MVQRFRSRPSRRRAEGASNPPPMMQAEGRWEGERGEAQAAAAAAAWRQQETHQPSSPARQSRPAPRRRAVWHESKRVGAAHFDSLRLPAVPPPLHECLQLPTQAWQPGPRGQGRPWGQHWSAWEEWGGRTVSRSKSKLATSTCFDSQMGAFGASVTRPGSLLRSRVGYGRWGDPQP